MSKEVPQDQSTNKMNHILMNLKNRFASAQGISHNIILEEFKQIFDTFVNTLSKADEEIQNREKIIAKLTEELNIWRSGKIPPPTIHENTFTGIKIEKSEPLTV